MNSGLRKRIERIEVFLQSEHKDKTVLPAADQVQVIFPPTVENLTDNEIKAIQTKRLGELRQLYGAFDEDGITWLIIVHVGGDKNTENQGGPDESQRRS
jgi:hypothetical protein